MRRAAFATVLYPACCPLVECRASYDMGCGSGAHHDGCWFAAAITLWVVVVLVSLVDEEVTEGAR